MSDRLEIYAVVPTETDDRAVPVLESHQFVGYAGSLLLDGAGLAGEAAKDNGGDGNFVARDAEGRTVGRIELRAGQAVVTVLSPGPTPSEALAAMAAECPFCTASLILIPCAACGCRRCARCMARRVCCNPNGDPPVEL